MTQTTSYTHIHAAAALSPAVTHEPVAAGDHLLSDSSASKESFAHVGEPPVNSGQVPVPGGDSQFGRRREFDGLR